MTQKNARRPGLKQMLLGGLVFAAALASIFFAAPLFQEDENNWLLAVIMVAMVAGAAVLVAGAVMRIDNTLRAAWQSKAR